MIRKNIYTIYFCIGIAAGNLLLFSCGSGECSSLDPNFVFTNSSGYDIEIITYALVGQDTFFVKDKDKIEKTSSRPHPDYIVYADSVKISFKDNGTSKKIAFLALKHGGKKSKFNILDLDNYESYIGSSSSACPKHHYTYTFTLADYKRAFL